MSIFEASEILNMESPNKQTVPPVVNLEKCRICLKIITNRMIIGSAIRQRFFDITQLELEHSEVKSKFVCVKCDKELRDACYYREKLIRNQKKLSEELGEDHWETVQVFEPEVINVKHEKEYNELELGREEFEDDFGGDYYSDQNDDDFMPENDSMPESVEVKDEGAESKSIKVSVIKPAETKGNKRGRKSKEPKKQPTRKRSANSLEVLNIDLNIEQRKVLDENGRTYYVCDYCGKNITTAFSLKEHILTQHTQLEKKFKCTREGCGRSYVTKGRLSIHLQTHKDDKKAICATCGAILYSKKGLREHMATVHNKEPKYFCDKCDYGAPLKSRMRSHVLTHLERENRMDHACHICGFISVCKKSLRRHIYEHRGITHACHCGKTFYYKGALQMHVRCVHKKVKPHVCQTCNKAFFNRQDLSNHIYLKHNTEQVAKNIPCDVCGKCYSLPKQLERHRLYHHVRYNCTFHGCDEYFNTEKRLQRHMKMHEIQEEKRFNCTFLGCEEYFNTEKKLERHMKKHQIKEEPN